MPLHRSLARTLSVAALVAAAGCTASESYLAAPEASRLLAGTWAEDTTVPGVSFVLSLTTRDTLVSGTGTYAIEAGRSGTLSVTGTVTGSRVTLNIVYDYGPVSYFEGAPPTSSGLAGAMKNGPKDSMVPSVAVSFHRTQGLD